MEESIANLVEAAPVFSVSDQGSAINRYFEENSAANGVVVVDVDKRPIGLVMRNHFYQNIGTQFGFAIYLNRSIELIMKKEILLLDSTCQLARFGIEAMNRPADDVYGYVIVTSQGRYQGVVSISNFLAAMSERKEKEIELLNQQQKILKEANEKEKLLRMQIEMKNKEIKNLMNHAEQGFLSFASDLIITEEYSKVCDEIFGQRIAKLSLFELLSGYLPEDQKNHLSQVFSSIFEQEKKKRAKTFIRLLPQELVINQRNIQLAYKIIAFKEKKMLMLILTDVTDKKALENKAIEEKNNMKLILSAVNHKAEILNSLKEAYAFFEGAVEVIPGQKNPLPVIFRTVHTMKGDFALHSFHNTAFSLHQLKKQDDYFWLSIRDDGRGIDPRVIAKKALGAGLVSQETLAEISDQEVINLIFEDNFSTRDSVSMLSGRGVGLSSVKEEVLNLGGEIWVESQIDCGTEFILKLPLH